MTVKEVENWLNRGYRIDDEIKQLERECREAYDLACGSVASMKADKVQTSRQNDSEIKFIDYVEYSRRIELKKSELLKCKDEISKVVDMVENRQYRLLLKKRYIHFDKWEKIAEDMNLSDRWVRGGAKVRALKAVAHYITKG